MHARPDESPDRSAREGRSESEGSIVYKYRGEMKKMQKTTVLILERSRSSPPICTHHKTLQAYAGGPFVRGRLQMDPAFTNRKSLTCIHRPSKDTLRQGCGRICLCVIDERMTRWTEIQFNSNTHYSTVGPFQPTERSTDRCEFAG